MPLNIGVQTSASAFSESPTYGEKSCAPLMDRKVAWHAVAAARTSIVLQQPGGPYSNTPRGRGSPSRAKESEWRIGHSTAWNGNKQENITLEFIW